MHDLPIALPAHAARAWDPAAGSTFDLPMPMDRRRGLALGWLGLGLAALAASGVFSLLLVASRTPGVNRLFPIADFFRVTLVVHVDLSVLVWFLAFAASLWSIAADARAIAFGRAGLAVATAGAAVMAAAPFLERAVPIMSNYVPVLDGRIFIAGLILFVTGVAAACARSMFFFVPVGSRITGSVSLRLGINASMVAAGMALFALAASFAQVSRALPAATYYELVFWGAGHMLQFAYTIVVMAAWLWLASAMGARLPISPRVAVVFFAIALAPVYVPAFIYLAYPVASIEHPKLQTWLMRFAGAMAVPPVAIAVTWATLRLQVDRAAQRVLRASVLSSLTLFVAGGLIGFTIGGSDVRIPAHYHGCIVGVTLALMGMTYLLLPRFGFAAPGSRIAIAQPWIYGGGQLLHITGLVISGGYGVQRKVAGGDQVLRSAPEVIGMGIMGAGGLIAVVGGLLFLVVVVRAIRGKP
jgi:hypothetical protein